MEHVEIYFYSRPVYVSDGTFTVGKFQVDNKIKNHFALMACGY